MILLLSCGLAAAAVVLLLPRSGRDVVERLGPRIRATSGRTGAGRGNRSGGVARQRLSPALAGGGTALVLQQSAGRLHLAILGVTVVGVGWAASALWRRGRARAERQARRNRVAGLCDALTAELQAGAPPAVALTTVAHEWPELDLVRDAADLGADVPAVLRELARRPGGDPFSAIAAGWEVASRSGAGLAEVLDRLATVLRDDQDVRGEVTASLASPRATARMLALLPLFGLGLGTSIGADPVGVLVETLPGALSLAAGSALAVAGLFWVERIADRAEV